MRSTLLSVWQFNVCQADSIAHVPLKTVTSYLPFGRRIAIGIAIYPLEKKRPADAGPSCVLGRVVWQSRYQAVKRRRPKTKSAPIPEINKGRAAGTGTTVMGGSP